MVENLKAFPVRRLSDNSVLLHASRRFFNASADQEDQVSVSVQLIRDRGKIECRLPRCYKLREIRKPASRSKRDLFGGRIRTQHLYKDRFFVSVFFEN